MDITMQKKAEEALLKARIEWERTFDALPDLIAIIDQKHRILRVNKSMAERLRLKPNSVLDYNALYAFTKQTRLLHFVHT
jgi:PAS domain-containing protein